MATTAKQGNSFRHGICGCCSDPLTALYGYCCICCLYGENVRDMGEGSCVAHCLIYYCLASIGCCCLVHSQTRKRLRTKYNIAEEPCNDCCVTTLCCPCAVCQEANELKFQATQTHGGAYYGTTQTTAPPQQQFAAAPAAPQYAQPPPSGATAQY